MTQEQILRLAFRQALIDWGKYKDRANRIPGNKIAARNEQQKWEEVKELEKMLIGKNNIKNKYNYSFDYNFWNLNPYVLNKGEECFSKLANKFNISITEQTEIENQAKDEILDALTKAYQENKNPLKTSQPFLLANLINQYKLDNLIEHICRKYNLNENDFYHDAYHDGTYLKIEYKNKLIA